MAVKPVQYATERSFFVSFSGVIPSPSARLVFTLASKSSYSSLNTGVVAPVDLAVIKALGIILGFIWWELILLNESAVL